MNQIPLILFAILFMTSCATDEEPLPKEVCGCTDESAANFSAEANCDNGSCVYLDNDKRTLNTLFTSTGCGACGIYGIDCHKNYADKMLDKALRFELHFKYGDPMINETNDSFVKIAGPRYSPFFAIGLKESMVFGEDRPLTCQLSEENAQKLIEEFENNTPQTQIGISQTITNDTLTAHFAINTLGNQNLKYAIYVLEDSLVYTQNAGWRNDIEGWVHNNVVQIALTPVIGTPLKTETKIGSISVHLDPKWKAENLYTMLVLWNTSRELPEVINAERTH